MKQGSSPQRPSLERSAASREWKGGRKYQEDRHAVQTLSTPQGGQLICVLCDGMGGHAAGDVASRLAVEAALTELAGSLSKPPGERLRSALQKANLAIGAEVKKDPNLKGMGCTFVATIQIDDDLYWISVGDSPMWKHDGAKLTRLNEIHALKTQLAEQVRHGEISAEDAERNPQREALTSAVMGAKLELYDLNECKFSSDEMLIIASDGVETLSDDEISRVSAQYVHDADEAVDALMKALKSAAGPKQDNTSIITVAGGESRRYLTTQSRPAKKSQLPWLLGLGGLLAATLVVFLFLLLSPDPATDTGNTGADAENNTQKTDSGDAPIASSQPQARPQTLNFGENSSACVLQSARGLEQACVCIKNGGVGRIAEDHQLAGSIIEDFNHCINNDGELPDVGIEVPVDPVVEPPKRPKQPITPPKLPAPKGPTLSPIEKDTSHEEADVLEDAVGQVVETEGTRVLTPDELAKQKQDDPSSGQPERNPAVQSTDEQTGSEQKPSDPQQ